MLRTAGLVTTRKQGRVVFRLADGFSEPLHEQCLHALVQLSRNVSAD